MLTLRRIRIFIVLLTLVVFSVPLGSAIAKAPAPNFETLSHELNRVEHLFAVASDGQTVVFDTKAAQRLGISDEGIKLAQETAALTNEIVARALSNARATGSRVEITTISIEGINIDMSQYPTLAAYNAEALRRVEAGVDNSSIAASLNSAQSVCGSKTNPVPSSAAPWVRKGPYNSKSAAETQLKNWGYYRAWWIPGGDWTRDQTYQQSTCKKNTYRDHAISPFQSGTKWYFNEQNYTGTVPGEPNPVMSALPTGWPYLTWPDYVLWWHNTY